MNHSGVREAAEAHVVLVRDRREELVYCGDQRECEAWLALNGDKLLEGNGHFELREGLPMPPRSR